MHTYAQTNLQLIGEMRELNYSPQDIEFVSSAYRFATQIFTCRYQPPRRVFISHVAGTAGILLRENLPAPVIAAGLIHNAYQNGDFGGERSGKSERKRAIIIQATNETVESYVNGFASIRWVPGEVKAVQAKLAAHGHDSMTETERYVLLIRLADHMEHLLDGEIHYYHDPRYLTLSREAGLAMEDIARRLGYPHLAESLEEQQRLATEMVVPAELVSGSSRAFISAPLSYCRRPVAELRYRAERWRQRLRSIKHGRDLTTPATR